ncbi:chemotaxis protein CheW [Marinisporobacter balticus]|uniref:Purine-binding chemotaxis protein CheW n=1 Tax=Marinisporobacter balticus TaxID=2018667 RepID=A0A4R2L9C5_9FIRM|nr:chemotaxis protein CheW [Marinisporobacter balticus]TCO79358.1 purine-binding chemotaxis protein CheW [Marinisporobacter balticus]
MAERQYVIFKLENEAYGVDIMNVKEITEHKESVKVPNTPKFVDGIINLRGDIIPIINLRKRFNLKDITINFDTRVIVITIKNRQVGFIVDEASQVLRISEENIEPAPELVAGVDKKYITGVGKLEDRIVLLLDLEYILTDDEKEKIQQIS